jgi:hypothetical protein
MANGCGGVGSGGVVVPVLARVEEREERGQGLSAARAGNTAS